MSYIGKEPSFGVFEKQILTGDGSSTLFTLDHPVAGAGSILVSLGGVIQEPIASFTILENQINFASAPRAGANFFCVVLATTNIPPLQTLTIGRRSSAHSIDLHGRSMVVKDRSGTNHPIAFNLA